MLERQRLLFRRKSLLDGSACAYEVVDPDTQEYAGVVREGPPSGGGFFHGLFFRYLKPARIEVRETEDESLLFTVSGTIHFFGGEVTIADADENVLGYLSPRYRSPAGRTMWVYDRDYFAFA